MTEVKQSADGIEFPFIRLWCGMQGSYAYYVNDEIARAKRFGLDWKTTHVEGHPESPAGSIDTITNLHTLYRLHERAAQWGWGECSAAINARLTALRDFDKVQP